jgi:hypothetical protein
MKEHLNLLTRKVGFLPNLNTSAKNEIVAAINELVAVKASLNGDSSVNFNTKDLTVSGQISSPVYDNNTTLTINWNNGNSQKIVCNGTNNPGTVTFSNLKNGAYYTLVIQVTIPNYQINLPGLFPPDTTYIRSNLVQGLFIVNYFCLDPSTLIGNIGGPFI